MAYEQPDPYFVVGGTLSGTALSYVTRHADAELLTALLADDYCYVLDTRQVGKSSLIVRAARRLGEAGRLTAVLDLSTFGDTPTEEQWYGKLLADLVRALGIEDEADAFWEAHTRYSGAQRWFLAVRDLVLPCLHAPMVVFVDEIESVRKLHFSSDGFFAMIRALYNLRATEANAVRLTFCLAGVATPADLIRDPRTTPFNIGKRITLRDFTPDEMLPLAKGLCGTHAQQEAQIVRIGEWTAGHPYLTQRFCQAASAADRPLDTREIDRLCREVFLCRQAQSEEANLHFVRRQILDDTASDDLLVFYSRVRAGRQVLTGSADTLTDRLLLSGLVRVDPLREPPRLMVRNPIYAHVFDRRWAKTSLTSAEAQRHSKAVRRGFLRASVVWCILAVSLLFALMRHRQFVWQQGKLGRITHEFDQVTEDVKELKRQAWGLTTKQEGLHGEIEAQLREKRLLYASNKKLADEKQTKDRQMLGIQAARRSIAGQVRQFQQKAAVLQEESDERSAADRAHQEAAVSGQGFEALKDGLKAVGPALQRGQSPSPEALRSLGQAANIGIYRLFRLPHSFPLETASFSSDNRWIVTAGRSHDVCIWEARTGALRFKAAVLPAKIVNPVVWSAEFSPDGKYLITAGSDQKARIWNLLSLQGSNASCVWSISCGTEPANRVLAQFSPSGRYVAVTGRSSGTYCAAVWDFATQKKLAIQKHTEEIASIDFNNKNCDKLVAERYLAVAGGRSSPLHILDFLLGREAATYTRPMADTVQRACFGYWNDSLYCAGNSGSLVTWNWSKPDVSDPLQEGVAAAYAGHQNSAAIVAASPDGYLLASAGLKDHQVRIWNLWYPKSPLYTLFSPGSNAASIHFSDDSSRMVMTQNRTAEIWLLNNPTYGGAGGTLFTVSLSPDGSIVAAPTNDRVTFWTTERAKNHCYFKNWARQFLGSKGIDKFPGRVLHVIYSQDGRRLATASALGDVRVWSVPADGGPIHEYVELKGHSRDSQVNCVAFSPDGRLLLSASDDGTAQIWDVPTRQPLRSLPHPGKVLCCAFSPDGKEILTGCTDGIIRLYDREGHYLREIRSLALLQEHSQIDVWSVVFSPDGRRFAAGSGDGNAYLWDRATGNLIAVLPYGHGQVFSAQFSSDGRRILTVGGGGYAEVWNVEEAIQAAGKGQIILSSLSFYSNSAALCGGVFSANGQYIYVAGVDCLVHRYSVTLDAFLKEARRIRRMAGIREPSARQGHLPTNLRINE